jgi:hypothetical protein
MVHHGSTGNAQSGAAYLENPGLKRIEDIIAIMPAWPAGKPHCRDLIGGRE